MGGMERIVKSLVSHLRKQRLDIRVILPGHVDDKEAAQTQQWFSHEGVRAETHPALQHSFRRRTLGHLFALWRLVRLAGAPVVNIHYCLAHIPLMDVLAIRLAGRRCIVSLHAAGKRHALPTYRQDLKTRLASHFCTSVVVVSRFQQQGLDRVGVASEKIVVIPCGVSISPARVPRAEARASLGLPPDSFVIATACRLVTAKGTAELIEAVSHIPDPCGELRLIIAGEGSEREALVRLADARLKGRCQFLGFVTDMSAFYQAADVFALASHNESFGLVYAEAALCGVPSVGTRVGGIPETVSDGETGLLAAPHDPGALAAALQTLWESPDLRERLGHAAQQRARAEFTEAVMVLRYRDVLGIAP